MTPMTHRTATFRLLPGVLLAACTNSPTRPADTTPSGAVDDRPTCPALPWVLVGQQAIAPAAQWPTWYAEAEACAGRKGDYQAIHWYGVDTVLETDGQPANIAGLSCADDVYVTSLHEPLLRHEMLHHILQTAGHPQEFFPRCAEQLAATSAI